MKPVGSTLVVAAMLAVGACAGGSHAQSSSQPAVQHDKPGHASDSCQALVDLLEAQGVETVTLEEVQDAASSYEGIRRIRILEPRQPSDKALFRDRLTIYLDDEGGVRRIRCA